jgi:hypothetical protein
LFGRIRQWVYLGLCINTVVKPCSMKTSSYNPSTLEVNFANALHILREEIQKHLVNNQITHVENHLRKDNPMVKFNLLDSDGDPHEIVVRIIQIPDKF